ncbi:MAG TPA: DUF6600 domain-containing protein [Candidatus Angelobacter sp.]
MKNDRLMPAILFALALTLALFAPLRAAADDDDPPSRVARLSYIHGAVSFQPAGTEDWVDAIVNRPITTGDKIWTDRDARAELHLGSASLRISSNTGFSFLNLDDNVTQIQLTAGDLRVRIKRLEPNESFEVDTPNLAFSLLRPGTYRISVNEAGDATVIKVRGGEGEVTGGGAAYAVHPQEVGSFFGTDQLEADIQRYHSRDDDDFDDWCAERDRREDRALSARYVSPDVVGYEDLDEYGSWRPVPEYGTIWFPRVTIVGWAPYRYGHWAYIPPWGYTWVDDSPWGFAPFHYGRWVFVRGAWGWVPAPPPVVGVTYVRPVYAPALVAWVGGPHFGVGVVAGGGVHVGWFPLGPREVYVPSYRVSRTYVNNVNISNTTVNTTVINNYYNTTVINRTTIVERQRFVNQGVGVTATNTRVLTSCQPVGRNVVHMDAREVSRAQVSVVTPAVAPERRAVFGSAPASRVRPPERFETRPVVAKIAPPPAPVPFVRQQQAIQNNGGRALSRAEMRQIQPASAPAMHPQVRMATQPAQVPATQDRDAGRFRRDRNEQDNRPGAPAATGTQNVPSRGNNPPASNAPAAPAATSNPPAGNAPNSRFPVSNNPPAASGAPTGNSPAVTNRPGEAHGDGPRGDRPPASGGNPPAVSNVPVSNAPPATGNTQPNSRFPVSNNPPAAGTAPAANNAPPSSNAPAAPPRTYNDRPGSVRPNTAESNPVQDQRRRQDAEDVRTRQDRDRQRVEQPQDRQRTSQAPQAMEPRPQQVEQKPQQVQPRPQQVEQKPQPVQPRPQQVEQRPPQVDQRAHEQRVDQRREQPRPEPKKEDRPKKDSDSKDKHDKDKDKDKNDRPH